ncbi:hypothetical protein F9C07_6426 [Aspergillus flavus]|uniref:NAD-dependent epimerase/dehydratase domain-containing protein n=1 Tax=Aspergillus flavus (strain ATCC 200026 / FGSC A1120 / IAM 13836 / NRRL 3357 / JCM 12722 / SRRC 167) TaxID=332952 RepID=A0A7U2QT75_ASPFN|nr:hypothetical protein AFLA_004870 [Aspergillus flavus NRRL3357]QRD83968.1 hypothetical protein F9C07_6426 [Aspergillus flavus]
MTKVLLTGATGYIGGTVLDHLIKSSATSVKDLTFDLLVRSNDAAEKLIKTYGDRVKPILWAGFTDLAFITDTAANYDIIINAGTGFLPEGTKAFIHGLARRIGPDTPVPWFIHISGCTNLSDRPLTATAYPDREWDDANGNAVYEFLKSEDARDPYPQRTTEVGVLTLAEETGVQAVSLNAPGIFGTGRGLFNTQGLVHLLAMSYILKHGYGYKLNDTANFDWVHVEDLADVFVLLVRAILEREDRGVGYIPSGKNGIIFPAVGRVSLIQIMEEGLDAAFGAGVLPREDTPKEKEIRLVGLQEVADEVMGGLLDMAERGVAGHKKMKGTVARRLLGWNPSRLEEHWRQAYVDAIEVLQSRKGSDTLETCLGK